MSTESTIEAPSTPRSCPSCGSATTGGRFCAGCGHDVLTDLAAPPAGLSTVTPRPIVWAGAVILIAGVLAVLGSVLPWLTAPAWSVPDYQEFSVTGNLRMIRFEGINLSAIDMVENGMIAIAIGLILADLGIALLARRGKPLASRIGALICVPVLVWVAGDGVSRVDGLNHSASHYEEYSSSASVGVGVAVIALAAVLTFIGAFIPARDAS